MTPAEGVDIEKGESLFALKELESRDVSWRVQVSSIIREFSGEKTGNSPLTILQKRQEAILLDIVFSVGYMRPIVDAEEAVGMDVIGLLRGTCASTLGFEMWSDVGPPGSGAAGEAPSRQRMAYGNAERGSYPTTPPDES